MGQPHHRHDLSIENGPCLDRGDQQGPNHPVDLGGLGVAEAYSTGTFATFAKDFGPEGLMALWLIDPPQTQSGADFAPLCELAPVNG